MEFNNQVSQKHYEKFMYLIDEDTYSNESEGKA